MSAHLFHCAVLLSFSPPPKTEDSFLFSFLPFFYYLDLLEMHFSIYIYIKISMKSRSFFTSPVCDL